MNSRIIKGSKVRARWLQTKPVSLAGVQMKFEGNWQEVTGTVKHIRGDHPTEPKSIGVCIVDNKEKKHWVDINHVVEILP